MLNIPTRPSGVEPLATSADKAAEVERLLDLLIEQDPRRAEVFMQSLLARVALRARLNKARGANMPSGSAAVSRGGA